MSQATPPEPGEPDPPSHPDVAVVVIARRGGEVLNAAVQGLTEAARTYGLKILALVPSPRGTAPGPGGFALSVRVVAVDAGESEAVWRGRALAESDADIFEFSDDATAALTPWEELAPLRLGLIRMDLGPSGDLRGVLERLAVPEPAPPPLGF